MRLIDAEKLLLEAKEANQFIPYEYASGWNDMLLNVIKAEQIDAVPVVRCRECKHLGFCGDATNLEVMGFYGYCSRGERKEDADNEI